MRSVLRHAGRLIVTAQLIDTRNDCQLRADRGEQSGGSVRAQAGIAETIIDRILTVVSRDAGVGAVGMEVPAAAMELYHHASELLRIPVMNDGSPEGVPDSIREAVRLLREVTEPRLTNAGSSRA